MWLWVVRSHASLAAMCAVLWAPSAHACECAAKDSPTAALGSSAAVFEGRVTSVTPIDDHDVAVELNVVRAWKNADAKSEKILVRTHSATAACGVAFAPDQSYLVYAQHSEAQARPSLEVSRCGRTQPINDAAKDIAELGMGVVPVSPTIADNVTDDSTRNPIAVQRDRPAAGGCASCSLGQAQHWPQPSAWAGLLLALALWRAARYRARHPA